MTSVGLRAITSAGSSAQQSPTTGKPCTSATSLHHFETPTRWRRAPMLSRIFVALGASETMSNERFAGKSEIYHIGHARAGGRGCRPREIC